MTNETLTEEQPEKIKIIISGMHRSAFGHGYITTDFMREFNPTDIPRGLKFFNKLTKTDAEIILSINGFSQIMLYDTVAEFYINDEKILSRKLIHNLVENCPTEWFVSDEERKKYLQMVEDDEKRREIIVNEYNELKDKLDYQQIERVHNQIIRREDSLSIVERLVYKDESVKKTDIKLLKEEIKKIKAQLPTEKDLERFEELQGMINNPLLW